MHEFIMADLDPRNVTGNTCRKSPPNSKVLPPKGLQLRIMSHSRRCTAVRALLGDIGASSQIIRAASFIVFASDEERAMDDVDVSFNGIGSLNWEKGPFFRLEATWQPYQSVLRLKPPCLVP